MDAMDVDPLLPGGDAFDDVMDVFTEAAKDMEPGSFILMDGFSLQDAISAFEIGEPRLDSGVVLNEQRRPSFDPLAPLLPEEVCWILDRSVSCEMEWHAGNTLSQTVFTLLFVHQLGDMDSEFLTIAEDPSRPQELIVTVLRPAVYGLLKCCNLAWKELFKGELEDGEDWQSEKCDVSLLEGTSVQSVLSGLNEAVNWLLRSTKISTEWRDALKARILLRKTILELMDSSIFKDPAQFQALIAFARQQLRAVQSRLPQIAPASPANLCFDPYIARRLSTFVPLRVLELPSPEGTWRTLSTLLDSWEELGALCVVSNITSWEIVGNLRAWMSQPPLRIPYIRSCMQSAFYDGVLVLYKFSSAWLVDHFFRETIGISYDTIVRSVKKRWPYPDAPPFSRIERHLLTLITSHIRALWFNPPRRRRFFMKSLVEWHVLYDELMHMISKLRPEKNGGPDLISRIPGTAMMWRLSIVREVVLSGFQLELYSDEEKAFAYWYATQVIEVHLNYVDSMMLVVKQESLVYKELRFQHHFLTALQFMTTAMFSVSMKLISFQWLRMRLNFRRRYKWAFRPEYDETDAPPAAPPDFDRFLSDCTEMLQATNLSASESMKLANRVLIQLIPSNSNTELGWAGKWSRERGQLIQQLANACEGLYSLPSTMNDIATFEVGLLKWDRHVHPWFPIMTEEGAEKRKNRFVVENA